MAELVNQGAQLDTPLLTVGFRTPSLSPSCLGAGSTALHMAAAGGRFQICVLILHAQQQRHPGLELRRSEVGGCAGGVWGAGGGQAAAQPLLLLACPLPLVPSRRGMTTRAVVSK